MFSSVLFPVDLHEPSRRIESVLRFLGRLGTERVLLLHVIGGETEHAHRVRRRLESMAAEVTEAGFQCETKLRRGSTATAIVETARTQEVDFICVPWKPKSWLQRTIVGSVTTDVVRLSDVPVLVHKEARRRAAAAAAQKAAVLYATDFQATDTVAAPYVKSGGGFAQTLHLLNVRDRAPDPRAEEKRQREARANLDRLARDCGSEYDTVEKSAVLGTPRRVIPRYANWHSIELIILGRADAGAPLQGIMGSTAQEVAHSTRCSLLIVPQMHVTKGAV